ncbi:hypothetical protein MMC19_003035 [Ptychographa xylographoides]|nr:hypothetical protein [Ptychographa xylographoides]
MLITKSITQISILSRKPVPMASDHPQVNVILHNDFSAYGADVLEKLKGAEGCVWALGVSATDVNKSDYVKITHDYPLATAKAFSSLSSPFRFVYVSGEGTTTTPGRFTPYFGVVKGQAEAALLALYREDNNFRPFSVRPALVDPAAHAETHPFLPQKAALTKAIRNVMAPVLSAIYKSGVSPTRELGRVLVDLAMGNGEKLSGDGIDGEGRTVSNKAFRRIAGI